MMAASKELCSHRVLDIVEVRALCLPLTRLHVPEDNGAMREVRLERPQADGVKIRVQASEAVQVQVAHSVSARDALVEGPVARQEPGVLLLHEALVVHIAPQHVRPVREALTPRARPALEAARKLLVFPALVQNPRHWWRVCEGISLFSGRD